MKFRLHKPTLRLLAGLEGVELGAAAHNPFGVKAINVAPEFDEQEYAEVQRGLGNEPAKIDLYGHAGGIPVDDESQDFVLSSHVLEHIPDPISAFLEWQRVVKPGGYVVMVVPQPNALPGDERPVSNPDDIKQAYKEKWDWETVPVKDAPGGHYWKFSAEMLKEFIADLRRGVRGRPGLKWELIDEEDPDSKVGNGFWLAYRVETTE